MSIKLLAGLVVMAGLNGFVSRTPAATPVPSTWLHTFYPVGTNLQQNAEYGEAVAVSGNLGLVGEHAANAGAHSSGVAWLYDISTGNLLHSLKHPEPVRNAGFGYNMAMTGTRAVLATSGLQGPVVYLYDFSGASPTVPVLVLTNPITAPSASFGVSLALSNERIVASASVGPTSENRTNVVFIFLQDVEQPNVPSLILTPPDPGINDSFGGRVAISGSRVAAGAMKRDASGNYTSVVYVYDLTNATPDVPAHVLNTPTTFGSDGMSIAISGRWLVVGIPRASQAYAYDLENADPALSMVTLFNPAPTFSDNFGYTVAISGSRVVVGAPYGYAADSNGGVAYLYDLTNTYPFSAIAALHNPGAGLGDQFGISVAMDGASVLVGARRDSTKIFQGGAAHVFGPRPVLSVVSRAPGLATLSWVPATSSGFVLISRDRFSPTNWLLAPSGATNPTTVPTTNAARFYRLFQP